MQRSLTRVGGVSNADVSLERGEAIVTFDDARTSVEALVKAVTQAGYRATVKK